MDNRRNQERGRGPVRKNFGESGFPHRQSQAAGTHNMTVNSAPDSARLMSLTKKHNNFYPPANPSDPQYRTAHAGFIAFQVSDRASGPHHLSGGKTVSSRLSDGMVRGDADTVPYVDTLNGMFNVGDATEDIVDRIMVMGITASDMNTGQSSDVGLPIDNTLLLSGKATIPNTGLEMIKRGDLVIWAPPAVEATSRKVLSGITDCGDFDPKAAPLLTVPKPPRCSLSVARTIHHNYRAAFAAGDGADNARRPIGRASLAAGRGFRYAIGTIVMLALRGVGVFQQDTTANAGTINDERQQIVDRVYRHFFNNGLPANGDDTITNLLMPTENPFNGAVLNNFAAPQPNANIDEAETMVQDGDNPRVLNDGANFGPDQEAIVRAFSYRAADDLIFAIKTAKAEFDDRVVGRALTTSSPGRDFDIMLQLGGRGSL